MDKEVDVHILVKIRAVVCPMMMMFCVGSYYCFSNINPYVAAYLNSKSKVVITDTDTLLVMPVWMMTQSVFSIISVKLADSFGYWILNLVAFCMFALVNLLASYVTSYSLFIMVYGFLTGLSIGIGYLPALYISWTYFPKHKSVVTGGIMFCAGISGIVLSPLSTAITNPNNVDLSIIRDSPEVYDNVPKVFRVMSAIFGSIALVAGLLQPKPYVSSMTKEEFIDVRATKEIFGRDVTNILKLELMRDLHDAPDSQNALILGQMTDENVEQMALSSPQVMKRVRNRLVNIENARVSGQFLFKGEDSGPKNDRGIKRNKDERESMEKIEDNEMPLLSLDEKNSIENDESDSSLKIAKDEDQSPLPSSQRKTGDHDLMAEARKTLVQESEVLESHDCPSMAVAAMSWPFFKICLLAFCCSIYNYFLNSAWKKFFPHQFDVNDTKMSFLLSVGALSNSTIRFGVGILLMRYSFKTLYLINITIAALNALTILQLATSYEVGAVYLALAFGGLGTQITLFPTICLKVFGPVIGPKMYPCAFFMFSVASMSQYMVLKLAHEDWQLMTRIFAGVTIVGILVALPFKEEYDWRPTIQRIKKKQEEAENHRRLREKQDSIRKSILSNNSNRTE